jgi:2-polyprenyl-6-methoxyphenol hydroxylase-like FAD-dependent oxidoreductase
MVGDNDNDNNIEKNISNNNDDNRDEKVNDSNNNHLNINPNLHIYEPKKFARIEKKKSKAKLEKNQSRHNVHISRQSLRKLLIKDINDENIIWNKHFKNYVEYNDHVMIYFHDDTSVKCALLVAADGIYSTIRKQLIPQPLTAVNSQATQNLV